MIATGDDSLNPHHFMGRAFGRRLRRRLEQAVEAFRPRCRTGPFGTRLASADELDPDEMRPVAFAPSEPDRVPSLRPGLRARDWPT